MKVVPKQGKEHGCLGSRMDAIILNIFEISYSQLIQYEILEKLVTCIAMMYIMEGHSCSFFKGIKLKLFNKSKLKFLVGLS